MSLLNLLPLSRAELLHALADCLLLVLGETLALLLGVGICRMSVVGGVMMCVVELIVMMLLMMSDGINAVGINRGVRLMVVMLKVRVVSVVCVVNMSRLGLLDGVTPGDERSTVGRTTDDLVDGRDSADALMVGRRVGRLLRLLLRLLRLLRLLYMSRGWDWDTAHADLHRSRGSHERCRCRRGCCAFVDGILLLLLRHVFFISSTSKGM
mmetsp:Transcript_19086/g.41284  ORF Transcript_19086/g.41284 Transcript_19086/m.41284 type:complete len:210 (-) Transcript_19086:35-664(-)